MDVNQKVNHLEARVAALEAWVQIPATQIPGFAAPEPAVPEAPATEEKHGAE